MKKHSVRGVFSYHIKLRVPLVYYRRMHHKKNIFKRAFLFFDRLEDSVRGYLSRRPLLYTIIGGFAIVLFWRGVWHTADLFPFLTGPVSILISVAVLLVTGLFVSFFVGDVIILSGIKKEKKVVDKTEDEILKESANIEQMKKTLTHIEEELSHIHTEHSSDNNPQK